MSTPTLPSWFVESYSMPQSNTSPMLSKQDVAANRIDSAMDNPNIKWLIHNIYSRESDVTATGEVNTGSFTRTPTRRPKTTISTAFGSGQFIGSTRNDIFSRYGIDAWSKDPEEQRRAMVALLDFHGDLSAIKSGDLSSLDNSRYWDAFVGKDKNGYNKIDLLTGIRPAGWEQDYEAQVDSTVWDPAGSWDKLNPQFDKSMRTRQKNMYYRKYEKDINADMRTAMGPANPKILTPSLLTTNNP